MIWLISIIILTYNFKNVWSNVCDGQQQSTDVIVILGQKNHSTYDATHSTSLAPILVSLERHICL